MGQALKAFFVRTVRLHWLLVAALAVSVIFLIINSILSHRAITSQVSGTDIGVVEVVRKLRSELGQLEAQRQASGDAAIFRVKDIDVELGFVIKADQSNKGEIHFEAVTVGGDQSTSLARSDKITLHMEIAPPTWNLVTPTQLSVDQNTKELPEVPLKRK
jgi:hypothetical protein